MQSAYDLKCEQSEEYAALFQFDRYTKLPNRSYLIKAFENRMLSFDAALDGMIGMYFIDFDDLNHVSDVIGMDLDDRMMLKISQDISNTLGPDILLCRVGHYRLVLLLEALADLEAAENFAKKLQHQFLEPVAIDGHLLYVNATIGISLYPQDAHDIYTLLKTAEKAMRRVKREGRNLYAFAQRFPNSDYDRQIKLMQDLPSAIENGEIYFEYQGQVDIEKMAFSGAEVLARWQHPQYGNIAADVFIPMAEQTGMIGPLTVKTLVEASEMFARLEACGRQDISISVNISPLFLMTKDFLDTTQFLHERYGLKDRPLNFEITEASLIQYNESLIETLEAIRKMGIGIEIDDFGTGYTSLQYLTGLPIDTLKIDKSFVSGIDKSRKKALLFKAIVDMAKAMEICIIAEGVETEGEDKVITRLGGIWVQGFFYSRPTHPDAFLRMVDEQDIV